MFTHPHNTGPRASGKCLTPAQRRDELLARLQTQGNLEQDDIETLKFFITTSDYLSRNDHCGAVMVPGTKHYRRDGTEHRFELVPFSKVLSSVESHIERRCLKDRRTAIWEKVMEAMPGRKTRPSWPDLDKPISNPRGTPKYQLSISKAVSLFARQIHVIHA